MRLLLLLLALTPLAARGQSTATYRVTFESTWSATTHPDGFPSNAHFSGLIGVAHDATATLWTEGELASDGIESMAETGSKTLLTSEGQVLVASGRASAILSGGGIGPSPGAVSMTLDLSEDFPLVSLVSMIAPSPDWFIGVDGLNLRENEEWVAERTVSLFVYDAGTDSGTTYTAPNADTDPPEPIAAITGSPFRVGSAVPPVGTFTFTRLTTTATDEAAPTAAFRLDPPAPNPVTTRAALRLHLDVPQSVRVEVFDVLGRRVATIHEGPLPAGTRTFNLDVQTLPGGIYFVRATGTETRATRRLVVQRR